MSGSVMTEGGSFDLLKIHLFDCVRFWDILSLAGRLEN